MRHWLRIVFAGSETHRRTGRGTRAGSRMKRSPDHPEPRWENLARTGLTLVVYMGVARAPAGEFAKTDRAACPAPHSWVQPLLRPLAVEALQ